MSEQGCNGITPLPAGIGTLRIWGSTPEGMEAGKWMLLAPNTHQHPLPEKEPLFRILLADKQQEKAGETPWGCLLPLPIPSPTFNSGRRDAPPEALPNDPGTTTPLAASPPPLPLPAPLQGGELKREELRKSSAEPALPSAAPPGIPLPLLTAKSQHLPAPLQPGDGNVEAIALGKAATVSQKQLFGLSATQALQHSCFPLPALTPSSPTHGSQQDPQPPAPLWGGEGRWGEGSWHSLAVLPPEMGEWAILWQENLQGEGALSLPWCWGLAWGTGISQGHQGWPVVLEHPTHSSQEMQRALCPFH